MPTPVTTRVQGLRAWAARVLVLATVGVVVGLVAAGLAAMGVDRAEVIATLLFLPVFSAALVGGASAGWITAGLVTAVYAAARSADIDDTGLAGFAALTATRAVAYGAAAWLGVRGQELVYSLCATDEWHDEPLVARGRASWEDQAAADAVTVPPASATRMWLSPDDTPDNVGVREAAAPRAAAPGGQTELSPPALAGTGAGPNGGPGAAGAPPARAPMPTPAFNGHANGHANGNGTAPSSPPAFSTSGSTGSDNHWQFEPPAARPGGGVPPAPVLAPPSPPAPSGPPVGPPPPVPPAGAAETAGWGHLRPWISGPHSTVDAPPSEPPPPPVPPPPPRSERAPVDAETRLWTAQFLCDRIAAAKSRSDRTGSPFSLVLVQVPDEPFAVLPYRRQVTLLRELGHQFVAGGVIDHLVHVPDRTHHWFAVVLPGIDRASAQVLERRLRSGIGGYLRSRGLSLGELESASLTAPADDPALAAIWDALVSRGDVHGERGERPPLAYGSPAV